MTKFNEGVLTVKFEWGVPESTGNIFQITAYIGDDRFKPTTYLEDDVLKGVLSQTVALPVNVRLFFYGKTEADTKVNESGEIVEDMFVKITSVNLDGFEFNDSFLHKNLTLVTIPDQRSITTSFVGFNGYVDIDLNQDNVFQAYMLLNKEK